MYQRVQREDVVRIPPERLGEDIDAVARELTRTTLEGKIGADKTLTLIASNIERVGEGRIVHGDGAVYQRVRYDALVFAPTLQEIVEGTVVEILKFGAFVRFGPLDRRGLREGGRQREEEERLSHGRKDTEGVQELRSRDRRGQVPPVRRRDVERLARLRHHRGPPAVRDREEDGHPCQREVRPPRSLNSPT